MTELFKACARGQDPLLKELGAGLVNRKLYKAVDVTYVPPKAAAEFEAAAVDAIRRAGLDPAYALVADSPSDTPYKPYDPDAQKPVNQILVASPTGGWQEISQASRSVSTIQKEYSLLRYYFPERIRGMVLSIAEEHLKPVSN